MCIDNVNPPDPLLLPPLELELHAANVPATVVNTASAATRRNRLDPVRRRSMVRLAVIGLAPLVPIHRIVCGSRASGCVTVVIESFRQRESPVYSALSRANVETATSVR
jgi:hypothetical protein